MPSKGELTGKYVPCDNCGKLIYRTPYRLQKNVHQFCCTACQKEYEHKEKYEDRPCEICGKLMHVSKMSTQRFCSDACQNEWQKTRVGDLNPKTNRLDVSCDWCGKIFQKTPSMIKRTNHNFCSNACRREWYAKVFSQQNEWKEASRERAIKMLSNGMMNTVNTKPQLIINDLLDGLNIIYNNEEPCEYYSIDNYIPAANLAIEVMGDFWHASPLKYHYDNLYPNQLKAIDRDKAKRIYLKNCHNMETLYLWEDDIYKRIDVCEKLIVEFINHKGELSNYNSFNYSIVNDELILNKEIIIPYQEQQVSA